MWITVFQPNPLSRFTKKTNAIAVASFAPHVAVYLPSLARPSRRLRRWRADGEVSALGQDDLCQSSPPLPADAPTREPAPRRAPVTVARRATIASQGSVPRQCVENRHRSRSSRRRFVVWCGVIWQTSPVEKLVTSYVLGIVADSRSAHKELLGHSCGLSRCQPLHTACSHGVWCYFIKRRLWKI